MNILAWFRVRHVKVMVFGVDLKESGVPKSFSVVISPYHEQPLWLLKIWLGSHFWAPHEVKILPRLDDLHVT